ncbi:MAG: hypothetical protein ACOC44_19860 [Promethearchaeia archaeon]
MRLSDGESKKNALLDVFLYGFASDISGISGDSSSMFLISLNLKKAVYLITIGAIFPTINFTSLD